MPTHALAHPATPGTAAAVDADLATVVVATYDDQRLPLLHRALDAVRDQGAPRVVVVVDHNEALADRLRRERPEVRLVANAGDRGASAARNTGVARATTPVVVFLDDDAVPQPGWLAALLAPLTDPTVAGTGGACLPAWEGPRPAWFPDEFLWAVGASYRGMPERVAEVRNVWSGNMAVRREVFEAVGGFRRGFGKVGDRARPEDTDLCIRMAAARPGLHWMYVPQAAVAHHTPAERARMSYFLRRCYLEGRGKVEMARLLGSTGHLGAEQGYLTRTVPAGAARELRAAVRGRDVAAAGRAASMGAGVAAAGVGAATGYLAAAPPGPGPMTALVPQPTVPATGRGDRPAAPEPAPGVDPAVLAAATAQLPALVTEVDLAQPLPALPDRTADGQPLHAWWVLARLATRPLGLVRIPLPGDPPHTDTDTGPGSAAGAPGPRHRLADALAADPDLAAALAGALAAADRPGEPLRPEGMALARPAPWEAHRARVLAGCPPMTVVLCTHDRPELLARCLDLLDRQEHPRLDVVVVDNAPSDERARGVVEAATGPARYVREPVIGLSRARNAGLAAARTDVVAFIDDDEVPDRWWAAELAVAFHDHPRAAAVAGAILPRELQTPAQLWFEAYGGHSKGRGWEPVTFGPGGDTQSPLYPLPPFGAGGNMAFRREALHRIGGFDAALGAGTPVRGGEDTAALSDLLLAGEVTVFHPAAMVWHEHRRDLAGLTRQMAGYGLGLTAFYTRLLLRDPRRIGALLRLAPQAYRDLTRRTPASTPPPSSAEPGLAPVPPELVRAQRRGMFGGPRAYLRSRRTVRRQGRG